MGEQVEGTSSGRIGWAVALGLGLSVLAVAAHHFMTRLDPNAGCVATGTFLETHREGAHQAVARAAVWLEALPVDPVELRARGLKGKKHFVEALDALTRLYRVASEREKPALLEKLRRFTAVTQTDGYHDMGRNEDLAFKQDATSYLRAALLMEGAGLDTTRYREEIRRIEPRLTGHLKSRGVHQRMVFAWYYRYFGLQQPFPLEAAFKKGVIARRVDPHAMTKGEMYALTHEVYVPFEYGDKLDAEPFTAAGREYLTDVLPHLVDLRIARNDPDLVAELVTCMRYLRITGLDAYPRGLQFLLDTQRADGAWGHYEQYRPKLGDLIEQAHVLHTTEVALDALTLAFHQPWNAGGSWCQPVHSNAVHPHDAGTAAPEPEEEERDEP